jgi:hypothetical protein
MPRQNRARAGSNAQQYNNQSPNNSFSTNYNTSYNPSANSSMMLTAAALMEAASAPVVQQRVPVPMSPNSKNMRNLGILHRKDPTIHTIIDSWALVTVYEMYPGGDWEQAEIEGPLFIFQRYDLSVVPLSPLNILASAPSSRNMASSYSTGLVSKTWCNS